MSSGAASRTGWVHRRTFPSCMGSQGVTFEAFRICSTSRTAVANLASMNGNMPKDMPWEREWHGRLLQGGFRHDIMDPMICYSGGLARVPITLSKAEVRPCRQRVAVQEVLRFMARVLQRRSLAETKDLHRDRSPWADCR